MSKGHPDLECETKFRIPEITFACSVREILVVVYCFENDIDLETLLCEAEKAFVQFAGVYDIDTWIA